MKSYRERCAVHEKGIQRTIDKLERRISIRIRQTAYYPEHGFAGLRIRLQRAVRDLACVIEKLQRMKEPL